MSLDDIKALPVEQVCARDCLLFMWTVSHLQAAAFDVAAAWGFKPVSVAFVWVIFSNAVSLAVYRKVCAH
jgi:N6-adenosine-specific RNA methylase IME4